MANSSSSARRSPIRAGEHDHDLSHVQKSFLAQAGQILASSLDYQKTLSAVADLMVPSLADWCFVYILNDGSIPELIAVSHPDPAKAKHAWEMNRTYPIAMDKKGGTASVVAKKMPILVADNVPDMLVGRASSQEHLEAMLDLGICSLMIVPLIARDRVLGILTLGMAESGVHYKEVDLSFAVDLATRAAVAVDNARLYSETQAAIKQKDEALFLLNAVLQQMPAGVVIVSAPDGKLLLRNQFATDFWCGEGNQPDPEQNDAAFFHPDGRPFKDEDWPSVRSLRTGEVRVGEEIEVVKNNGEHRILRVNSGPVRDREGNIIASTIAFGDVTQQRMADRALRESEAKFRGLAEVAPCAIVIHDGERVLYMNRATCEITGYTRQELSSKPIWEILYGDSVNRVRELVDRRSKGLPVSSHFEERIICKDGSKKWISFSSGTIPYEGKSAVITVALDVTERRRVDEQLRLSQERVRLASESAGISSWEWDIRTNRVIWSPEVYRIFGFGDVSGNPTSFDQFLARIHDDDRQKVRDAIEKAVSTHTDISFEFRLLRDDGEAIWAHSRAKIFYDSLGQPERMVGVSIDVTANKQAEAALRESEERFRAMFNQAAVGMGQTTPDGTFLRVNHKFEEIVGYSELQLIGKKFQDLTHPDDLHNNVEKLDALLAAEIPYYSIEKRYVRSDGSETWVQVTASLVRDQQGNPKYTVAVVEDITDRRRAAEALRNSERLAATGRLAATIAHEINNPLEAVTNLLYLLDQNKSLDDAARGYATMAQEEVSRVAHIARQTLGFYRDSTRLEAVQVSRLMDEVVSLFAAKIRTNEVEVRKELEADPPIEAFPGELRQVFSNLVANALDAVGKKGRLHIRIRPVRSVRNHSQKGVRLTVADNGPGISRIDQLRIFEPFFTTKGAKGTGLGLWVTRGIVEKHGGTISVRSSTNKGVSGTAFSVFLPLKQKAEAIRRRALSQVS